jgi:hypothetical protein
MILELVDDTLKTSLRLPRILIKRVKQYALDHDTNVTSVLIEALEDFLSKKEGSETKKK